MNVLVAHVRAQHKELMIKARAQIDSSNYLIPVSDSPDWLHVHNLGLSTAFMGLGCLSMQPTLEKRVQLTLLPSSCTPASKCKEVHQAWKLMTPYHTQAVPPPSSLLCTWLEAVHQGDWCRCGRLRQSALVRKAGRKAPECLRGTC